MPLEFITGLEREIGITIVTVIIIWYFWKQGERMERARLRNHERMLKQDERYSEQITTLFQVMVDCFKESVKSSAEGEQDIES